MITEHDTLFKAGSLTACLGQLILLGNYINLMYGKAENLNNLRLDTRHYNQDVVM